MNQEVKKVALGAILASLSVVLKLAFDMWLPIDTFGFPFYAIPLILGGLFLGPIYGFAIALVADTTFGLIQGYLPLFLISSLCWGVIPSLLTKRAKGMYFLIVVLITYLMSNLANTFAIGIHFTWKAALSTLPLRVSLVPVFGVIIGLTTMILYQRLEPILPIERNIKSI